MRLQTYLIEVNIKGGNKRSISITRDEALDIVKKRCKDSLKGTILSRSVNTYPTETFLYVEPSKHERYSRNTSNEYTLLFDHILPSWKKFPKRSRSLICKSVSYDYPDPYTYKVFPYDGSKIGMCPKSDIWWSFDDIIPDLSEFNSFLKKLSSAMRFLYNDRDPRSLKKFLKAVDEQVIIIRNKYLESFSFTEERFFEDFIKSGKTFLEYLEDYFDPSKNDFKIWTIGDTFPVGREVWTEGNSVMVLESKDLLDQFLRET